MRVKQVDATWKNNVGKADGTWKNNVDVEPINSIGQIYKHALVQGSS